MIDALSRMFKEDLIQIEDNPHDNNILIDSTIYSVSDLYNLLNNLRGTKSNLGKVDEKMKFKVQKSMNESYLNNEQKIIEKIQSGYNIFINYNDGYTAIYPDGKEEFEGMYIEIPLELAERLIDELGLVNISDKADSEASANIVTYQLQDESLNENDSDDYPEWDEKEIQDFIEDLRGYTDYDGIVEAVMDDFNLDSDTAESIVWDYLSDPFNESLLKQRLNRMDRRCLDESVHYYDLLNLYEAVKPQLTAQEKQELKNLISSTNDPETISSYLDVKLGKDDKENLKEDSMDESWSGKYSPSFLQNELGIDKNEAKEFSIFLWDNHADEGYRAMRDIADDYARLYDGKSALEYWYAEFKNSDENSLDETLETDNPKDDELCDYFIKYEPYDRYARAAKVKEIRFKALSLKHAVEKIAGRLGLYLTPEAVDEDFDGDARAAIESIKMSNGDGCDYIIEFKNLTTGEVYINGNDGWDLEDSDDNWNESLEDEKQYFIVYDENTEPINTFFGTETDLKRIFDQFPREYSYITVSEEEARKTYKELCAKYDAEDMWDESLNLNKLVKPLKEDYTDEDEINDAIKTINWYYHGDLKRFLNSMAHNCPIDDTDNAQKYIVELASYLSEFNESLNEDGYEKVISDLESIENYLIANNFSNYEVFGYDNYPMETSKIVFEVSGDWKHDHLLFKDLVNEWADKNNRKIFKIDSEEVGHSDSDNYEAIYNVYITKDDDSYNILNSMRGLFSESLNESTSLRNVINSCLSKLSSDSSLDEIKKVIVSEMKSLPYIGDNDYNNIFDEVIVKLSGNNGPYIESLEEGYSSQELIDAVQDAYGYNKTQALKYIKTLSDDAKKELIQGLRNNAKKSFLTDSLGEDL